MAFEHPLGSHLHRQVTGPPVRPVCAAHQHRWAATAVSPAVDGQLGCHNHRRPRADRVARGVLRDGVVLVGQQPQVDGAGQRSQRGQGPVDELTAAKKFLLYIAAATNTVTGGAFGQSDGGVVVVLHFDRAADRRVGVQNHGLIGGGHAAHPRCSATIPPDRFFHWTRRQPTLRIMVASVAWSGQAMIDSIR